MNLNPKGTIKSNAFLKGVNEDLAQMDIEDWALGAGFVPYLS